MWPTPRSWPPARRRFTAWPTRRSISQRSPSTTATAPASRDWSEGSCEANSLATSPVTTSSTTSRSTGSPTPGYRRLASTGKTPGASSTPRTSPSHSPSACSLTSSIRLRGAGQSGPIRTISSTTTSSIGAATSPPGNSRSSSCRRCATRSGRCAERRLSDTPTQGAPMTEDTHTSDSPTVMLVHGAFADGSSWNGVIERLRAKGVPVTAPANPLRGINADSAYIASVLGQIDGPVRAVGHSYGGAVITNAATEAANVVGLVYVAAFAPDEGEVLGAVEADSKDSVLNSVLVGRRYPTGRGLETELEFSIDPERFHEAFASDVPEEQARV